MNTVETCIFFIWVLPYLYSHYTRSPTVRQLVHYHFDPIKHILYETYLFIHKMIIRYNEIVYPDFWEQDDDTEIDEKEPIQKKVVKYEDKYLDCVRTLNKQWQFTEEELNEKAVLVQEFYDRSIDAIQQEIEEQHRNIQKYEQEIKDDTEVSHFVETYNEEGDTLIEEINMEERNAYRREQIQEYNKTISQLQDQLKNLDDLKGIWEKAMNEAEQHLIQNRLHKLSNNFVIENTPQGNVLMHYNKQKESFTYYSDLTIPYRYLEVVARKYVKMFDCRPLFIDMEEELKLVEEKWTKEYERKKEKELKEKALKEKEKELKDQEQESKDKEKESKKNVFAKFKSYNKDAGGGGSKINMAAPPKNSIPTKQAETKENEKILLKEKANRYTYEGKMVNFPFLQKIERKVFNKKLAMTFAEFKKMQESAKKNEE